MKTLSFIYVIIFSFVIFISFNSCETEEEQDNSNCRIVSAKVTVGLNDTATYIYTYNAEGKLIKAQMTEDCYFSYSWETNKVTVKYYDLGLLSYTNVFILNENGRAISSNYIVMGFTQKNTTYEYDDEGYLITKTVVPTGDGDPTDIYTYHYNDGNLTTEFHSQEGGNYASNTSYEYYTDKKNTYIITANFLGKPNNNLVKKITLNTSSPINATTITNYSYQLGSDGRVIKQTMTIGENSIYTLPLYECE